MIKKLLFLFIFLYFFSFVAADVPVMYWDNCGRGNISGSGTPNQLAYFDTSSTIKGLDFLQFIDGTFGTDKYVSFGNAGSNLIDIDDDGNIRFFEATSFSDTTMSLKTNTLGDLLITSTTNTGKVNASGINISAQSYLGDGRYLTGISGMNYTNLALTNQSNTFTNTTLFLENVNINKSLNATMIIISNTSVNRTNPTRSANIHIRKDYGYGGDMLVINPSTTNDNIRFCTDAPCYAAVWSNVTNFVDVPYRLLQKASTDTSYCNIGGATCATIGTDSGSLVITGNAGSKIMRKNGGGVYLPFLFIAYANDTTSYNTHNSVYSFDTGTGVSNTTIIVVKNNGVTKLNISSGGSLSTYGNITTFGVINMNASSIRPSCTVAVEGTLYYNFTTKKHEGCNSTTWNNLY